MFSGILSFLEKYAWGMICALAACILVAGIGYSVFLGDRLRFLPDEQYYVEFTYHLVDQGTYSLDGIQPTAYRPPGYSFLLAPIYFLGGKIVAFRIANFLLLAGTVLLVGRFLQRASGPLAALLGALFTGGYAVFFFTAGTLYPQTMAGFLFVLILYLFYPEKIDDKSSVLMGVSSGL